MNQNEIKKFIAEKVDEGLSLSQIQDLLNEKNVKMTFMDLRLIASEIESGVWTKHEKSDAPQESEKTPNAPQAQPSEASGQNISVSGTNDSASPALRGRTTVEINPIVRPGAVASGSVKFGSGATADWFLDQQGRLGLEKASGQPDQQDIQEFQQELQKAFSGAGA